MVETVLVYLFRSKVVLFCLPGDIILHTYSEYALVLVRIHRIHCMYALG